MVTKADPKFCIQHINMVLLEKVREKKVREKKIKNKNKRERGRKKKKKRTIDIQKLSN